jgi:hypothetical protein
MKSRISPLRALAVTLGLVAAGGLVGAACGALAFAIVLAIAGESLDPGLLSIGGAFGAAAGTIVAPLISWLFLRHVPLGRAIAHTALGTIVGGAIGFFLPTLGLGFAFVPGFLYGGLAGCTAAAVRLKLATPRATAARLEPGDSVSDNG